MNNLGVVERKVLAALLNLTRNTSDTVRATTSKIAECMGYKTSGGAITFALRILERDNYIAKTGRSQYKLFV